ncbi:MAG: hypothetical protein ACLQIQ_12385 [Beijerinckiaceae bacterium]
MVSQLILRNDIEALREIAERVARGLAYAKVHGNDVSIQTPIAFPSGRLISIRLLGGPNTFTITDDGAAMREAEMMGADDICRREARKVAAELQLTFNDWEIFEAQAPADRLVGLTSIVANAVAITLLRTCDKFAERFEIRRKEELSLRLARIFGERNVTKDVEIAGASTKVWPFDAKVNLPSERAGFFSRVSPSPVSIAFAYSKLDDVSRLENPPFLGAVLEGKFEPSDQALLRRAARRVFQDNDSDDTFRLAA